MWIYNTFFYIAVCIWASPMTQQVKNPPEMQEMQETQVWSLGQEYPLEEGMATCSSILAGKIPWTEDPGGLGYMGSQRVGHNCSNWAYLYRERQSYLLFTIYQNFQSLLVYEKKIRSRKMKRALQSLQWKSSMLLFPSSRVSYGCNPGVLLLTLCSLSSFSAVFLHIRLIKRAKSSYYSVLLLFSGYVMSDSFETPWAAHQAPLSMGFSL